MLKGDQIVLRPAAGEDVPALRAIVQTPEVQRYWGENPDSEFIEEIEGHASQTFVIELAGRVIGMIYFEEEEEPRCRHARLEIFISPEVHGRGLGPDAVRVLARHLIDDRGHHRITIDPAADNVRAIAAYSKVGFRPVGIMREYELGMSGTWHDCLLMDLLRGDLI